MINGVPKFNALALLEIDAMSFVSKESARVTAHAAYVCTDTGGTFGKTTLTSWSRETREKLEELKASMERDFAAAMFKESESVGLTFPSDDPGGIGEHAAEATPL